MKIVEAISDGNIGGAGVLLVNRLRHSETERNDYAVILPEGSALCERLRGMDVRVWTVRVGQDRSFSWRSVCRYWSILRRIRPDLINCHGNLSCRIAALLCRVPCRLYTRHCAYDLSWWQTRFPGKWLIGRAQGLLSHHAIAVADAARQNLLQMGVEDRHISVIINGSEEMPRRSDQERQTIRARLKIPKDAIVVGICARLEPCKDHVTFLRAAERLLSDSKRYRFLIVGDGSLCESYKSRWKIHSVAGFKVWSKTSTSKGSFVLPQPLWLTTTSEEYVPAAASAGISRLTHTGRVVRACISKRESESSHFRFYFQV